MLLEIIKKQIKSDSNSKNINYMHGSNSEDIRD